MTARGFAAPSSLLGGGGFRGSIAGSALAARSVWQPQREQQRWKLGALFRCSQGSTGAGSTASSAQGSAGNHCPRLTPHGENIAPPIPSPDFVSVNREVFVPPLHMTANGRCGTSTASELQHKAITDFQHFIALTSQALRSALIDGFKANTMDQVRNPQRIR